MYGSRKEINDEIFMHKNILESVDVLMELDVLHSDPPTTPGNIPYDGRRVPLVWTHRHGLGMVLYTALGHSEESFENAGLFRTHLVESLKWLLHRR